MRCTLIWQASRYLCLAAATLCWVPSASAVSLNSYESGVAAAASSGAAADPTGQGWLLTDAGSSSFAHAGDSGDGGWRVAQGSPASANLVNYTNALDAAAVAALSSPWTLDWTFFVESSSASDSSGSSVSAGNSFFADPTRDTDGITLNLDTTSFSYRLEFSVGPTSDGLTGNLFVNDGTNVYQLTADGMGFDTFYSPQIVSDGTSATLEFGGSSFALADSGPQGTDQILFGSDTPGFSGTIWNRVSLEASVVPEPASIAMLGLIGLGFFSIRRRK